MSEAEDTMNMDSLLDETLDDLEDLPEFKPYPAGAHQCLATFSTKEINGNAAIELGFKLVETLEFANPQEATNENGEPSTKQGDTASTMFMLNNEFGRGNLKKCATPFGEALGLPTIRDIVNEVQDIECVILTSIRTDKNDKDKHYLNVKEIQVLGAAAPAA
jgi:hypothetical protein